jgi:toxin-antitoxin system PIN domain toxin
VTTLLDGNVLVALTTPGHVHSEAAHRWWADLRDDTFATCPITQGTVLRLFLVRGGTIDDGVRLIRQLSAHQRHEFWPDDIGYLHTNLSGVLGHRQVTDAYLAGLARHHRGRLATFDAGLAALHDDVTDLVATS